jgi:hypothetical protein
MMFLADTVHLNENVEHPHLMAAEQGTVRIITLA